MATQPEQPNFRHIPVGIDHEIYPRIVKWVLGATAAPIAIAVASAAFHISPALTWYAAWTGGLMLVYDLAGISFPDDRVRTATKALGKSAKEWPGPGFEFNPPILTERLCMPSSIVEEQIPADPEFISRMHDADEKRVYMKKPIRVTSAPAKEGEANKKDPLNGRLTFSPLISISYQLERIGFFQMYVNLPGNTWLEKRYFILKMLRDAADSLLREVIPQFTAAEVNSKQAEIVQRVWDKLIEKTDQWGIIIVDVGIQGLEPPLAINQAFESIVETEIAGENTVTTAKFASDAKIIAAEADLQARIKGAQASYIETTRHGEAQKKVAADLGMRGSDLAALQMVEKTIAPTDKTIVGVAGVRDLLAMGKAVMGTNAAKKGDD
jgi:hypothetical protein